MKLLVRLALIGAAALAGPMARSAPSYVPTVEERLRALEEQVLTLGKENAVLRKELGWKEVVAPVLPQPGGHESKLIVGGFLQAQGEFGRASDTRWNGVRDRFFFRRARIYLAGSYANGIDFKAELDLQGNTLGAGTDQLPRANEIYLGWHRYDYPTLRLGQLKPAFGAEALAGDTSIYTIERSLSSDRLTSGRQLAASVSGDLQDKALGYLVVVANGNGANVSANDNSKFQKSARLTWTPVARSADQLTLGVDGLWTEDLGVARSDFGFRGNAFSGRRTMRGVDLLWTHGPLNLSAEWLHGTFKPVDEIPAASFASEGWYATASWFVIPARLQLVVRQEAFDPSTRIGGNTVRTTTFGLNYHLKGDAMKFMINYLDGTVPGSASDGGRLLTRVQVIF